MGLIHQSVPPGGLAEAAENCWDSWPRSHRGAPAGQRRALANSQHATLGQSMAHELSDLELSGPQRRFQEGLSAFRDRRTPDFRAVRKDRHGPDL